MTNKFIQMIKNIPLLKEWERRRRHEKARKILANLVASSKASGLTSKRKAPYYLEPLNDELD